MNSGRSTAIDGRSDQAFICARQQIGMGAGPDNLGLSEMAILPLEKSNAKRVQGLQTTGVDDDVTACGAFGVEEVGKFTCRGAIEKALEFQMQPLVVMSERHFEI
jgi:hypothetical protein